jgi:hypothetical protein
VGALNGFAVEAERLRRLAGRLDSVGIALSTLTSRANTDVAEAVCDSFVSRSALSAFGDAVRRLFHETSATFAQDGRTMIDTAERYLRTDEQAESELQTVLRQSRVVGQPARFGRMDGSTSELSFAALSGIATLDDVAAPAARMVNGATDAVQEALERDAGIVLRSADAVADAVDNVPVLPLPGVPLPGSVAAGVTRAGGEIVAGGLRVVNGAVQVVEDAVNGLAEAASTLADRADRVLFTTSPKPVR